MHSNSLWYPSKCKLQLSLYGAPWSWLHKRGCIVECLLTICCAAQSQVAAALDAGLMFPYNPSSPPLHPPHGPTPKPTHTPHPHNPSKCLRVAAPLLQVWMRRQHLSGQPDGFSGFLMSMLTAHLVQQSRLVRKTNHVHAALWISLAAWLSSIVPRCFTLILDEAVEQFMTFSPHS